MDSSRTRFLLRAMRPNGADHADPTFSDALQHTRADPELRRWFEREQAVDRALAAKLREVRAPAELRAQILQGVALSSTPRVRRPFALAAAALAAAASIALVFYTLLPSRRPVVSFDLLVTAAVRDTAQPPELALQSGSGEEIRAWLEKSQVPLPGALPGKLATQEVVGCNAVEWQGVRCSLVTLRAPDLAENSAGWRADISLLHLYTIPRNSCSSQGVGRTPQIATRDDATVATWRDAERYYVLVARAPPANVQELLGPDARVAWAGGPEAISDRCSVIRIRFLAAAQCCEMRVGFLGDERAG